jgi:molecular chaperone IbpA
MNRLDFTPYRRSMVGFDRIFDMLENQTRSSSTSDNFPPFNIEQHGDDSYRITLAVAGFKPADLEITAQQNLLVIQGRKPILSSAEEGDETGGTMLHVGIAQRGFERRFELADYVRVANAGLEDGLLTIDLVREVPEAMLPKKIVIGAGAPLSVVNASDHSKAA